MNESIRPAVYFLAEVLVGIAFFMWSTPLGLIYCGIALFMATTRKKITPEELAAAWLKHDHQTSLSTPQQAEAIAHLVLKKLKGRRA